mgnify:CR=1 FL=1
MFRDDSSDLVGFKRTLVKVNLCIVIVAMVLVMVSYELKIFQEGEFKKWLSLLVFLVLLIDSIIGLICKEVNFGTIVIKFKSTPDSFVIRLLVGFSISLYSLWYFVTHL